MNHNIISLLLAMDLVELQNTFEKKLNRKILERPNKCYIFEKLEVQGFKYSCVYLGRRTTTSVTSKTLT